MRIDVTNLNNVYDSEIKTIDTAKQEGFLNVATYYVSTSSYIDNGKRSISQKQFEHKLKLLVYKYKTVYTFVYAKGLLQVNMGIYIKK